MANRTRIHPFSALLGVVGLLALVILMGATVGDTTTRPTPLADTTATPATRVAIPAADIVNIAGRKGGNTPPNGTLYTVPGGKTLIVHSYTSVGYSAISFTSQPVGFNLNCGMTILVPREVQSLGFGATTSFTTELGYVCPAGSAITLTGPSVGPLVDSIGWVIVGELQ